MNDGTDDYYYAHDHLYSPVALIEDDGDVIGRYEYDAYGRMTRFDPDFTPWSGTEAGNPYYFTGRRLDVLDDGDLDIMYYRNRYYDTETGRFLTQDPMGIVPNGQIAMNPFSIHKQYKDGMSIYEYVKNNPVIFSDSSGLGFPSDEDTKDFDACVKGCDDDFDLCMATARILRDLCLQVAIDAIGICRDDCRDLPFPLDYVCMVGCGAGGGIAISMCMSAYAGAGTGCSLGFFICFDTCRGDCSTGRNRPF